MLSDDVIKSSVEKYLNQSKSVGIPQGHTTALVIHGDTDEGGKITAAVAKKVGDSWQVDGLFDWSHSDGYEAGFNVVYSK